MSGLPAIRRCLGSLALICSLALVAAAPPADAAKCTKKGTNGDDVLRGSKKKADVLCGRGGNDILIGRGGNDLLLGGDGDDTLRGGLGNDKLKGQAGTDTASYVESLTSVTVNLANGTGSGEGDDKLSAVENTTGSAHNDTLVGDPGPNVLSGGEGNDSLSGGEGSDTLAGEGGTDTANFFAATASIDADLLDDVATGQGADSLPGIENVTGSSQADTLAGDPGDNTLHGGAGTDTVSYAAATGPVAVDLATDSGSGDGTDALPAIENATGSPQADTLAGDSAPNVLDGGAGADTASYAAATTPVTVDLVNATGTGEGTDALPGIENAIGSPQADALVGDAQDNSLSGGDGNDMLAAWTGADVLSGDDGDDQIYGEADDDDLAGGPGDDLLDGGTGADVCDGGPGTNQLVGGCDSAAPDLSDFQISPLQIDTSISAQQVTFILQLADALAGVDPIASEVEIFEPGGQPRGSASLELLGGDPNAGTYEAVIAVPRFAPTGTWTVGVTLADESGNKTQFSSAELIAASLPGTFEQSGAGDSAAPQLVGFDVSPAQIDTSQSAKDITFTLQATDNLAGLDPAASEVEVFSPAGAPRGQASFVLVAGTPTDGTYEATVTVPRLAAQGTWAVALTLVDTVGNHHAFSTAGLIADGFPGGFEQTAVGDAVAPDLTDFTFAPAQVNTAQAAQIVTFDLDASDDLSGIDLTGSRVIVTAPDGQPRDSEPLELVSGTATDGTYRTTIVLPVGSVPGTWIVSVSLFDEAGNQSTWSSSELIGAGFQGIFTNVGPDPS
ncbi:MAG: calcium-binding protein [bacterium]